MTMSAATGGVTIKKYLDLTPQATAPSAAAGRLYVKSDGTLMYCKNGTNFKEITVQDTVWINELHYDNDGIDANEAIEVAGDSGTNLTGWSIELFSLTLIKLPCLGWTKTPKPFCLRITGLHQTN